MDKRRNFFVVSFSYCFLKFLFHHIFPVSHFTYICLQASECTNFLWSLILYSLYVFLAGGWGEPAFKEIQENKHQSQALLKNFCANTWSKLNKSSMIEYFPSFNTNKPSLCWAHTPWDGLCGHRPSLEISSRRPSCTSALNKGLRIMFPMLLVDASPEPTWAGRDF